jgi:hypothetical protein
VRAAVVERGLRHGRAACPKHRDNAQPRASSAQRSNQTHPSGASRFTFMDEREQTRQIVELLFQPVV